MKITHGSRQNMAAGQSAGAAASVAASGHQMLGIRHRFEIECFDSRGNLKWRDEFDNLVVNTGLNDYLDKYYKGSGYTAAHYVGLTDGTPTFAAADTMASHGGWVEVTNYTVTDVSPDSNSRALYNPGTVASQSVDNSASKAIFAILGSVTVGGAFIATDSTKGGTSGTLVGGNSFTGGDRTLSNGDTLNVTITASMTSS